MDYNSRKTGIGSSLVSSATGSPRDPSKSGRPAAPALGRTSKEYSHSGDAARRGVSKPESSPRISKDYAGKPRPVMNPAEAKVHVDRYSLTENAPGRPTSEKVLQRPRDDRERDILHQSLKRTKGEEDSSKPQQHHRDRDILNQSLKRTKVLDDSKPRLKDDRERPSSNQSLYRTKVVDDSKPRLKDDRERPSSNQSLYRTKGAGGEDLRQHRLKDERDNPRTLVRDSEVKAYRPKAGDDSKVLARPEKPRPESVKKTTTATRPQHDAAMQGLVSQKVSKKETTSSTKALPQAKDKAQISKTLKTEDVRKGTTSSSERKRPLGVSKLDDGKDVRVRSITKIEPVTASSHSTSKNGSNAPKASVKSVKMVTGSVTKAKVQEKLKKKVFSLPGQRFEPPEERDALRLFYGSLHRQIPTSDMANIWLMEHGLLEADEAQKVLTQKVKSKTGGVASKASPYQTPTPSRVSNGSAGKSSKFKNESFLDVKPVSKKLRL